VHSQVESRTSATLINMQKRLLALVLVQMLVAVPPRSWQRSAGKKCGIASSDHIRAEPMAQDIEASTPDRVT